MPNLVTLDDAPPSLPGKLYSIPRFQVSLVRDGSTEHYSFADNGLLQP